MKVVDKPWGREEWWADVPGQYLGKILRVNPGCRLSLQYHVQKDETLRGLEGYGLIYIGDNLDTLQPVDMRPGTVVHVPPGKIHRIENNGALDLVLLEVSTYYPDDVVRMADDYSRDGDVTPQER